MHKIILSGNLTRDPELKQTSGSGITYCSFSIAVNRWEGNKKVADFYNVTAWRNVGESIHKNFKKGDKILIFGEISLRKDEKNGEKKLYIDITANDYEIIKRKTYNKPEASTTNIDNIED